MFSGSWVHGELQVRHFLVQGRPVVCQEAVQCQDSLWFNSNILRGRKKKPDPVMSALLI